MAGNPPELNAARHLMNELRGYDFTPEQAELVIEHLGSELFHKPEYRHIRDGVEKIGFYRPACLYGYMAKPMTDLNCQELDITVGELATYLRGGEGRTVASFFLGSDVESDKLKSR